MGEEWDDVDTNITAVPAHLQKTLTAHKGAPRRACFVVLAGASVGKTFSVEIAEVVIGRGLNATVQIDDDGVSRRHARAVRVGDDILIDDLESANGTFVNGARVERHVLKDGDKVRLGPTTILKFAYQDPLDEAFQKQMYDAALRDGLTKIFNKRYLQERMTSEVSFANRHKKELSIILIDVDHFKRVNDTFGHLAGDHVLARLAEIATAILRTEDVIGRYGGEEFMVICRGISAKNAAVAAERLRAAIESSKIDFGGNPIKITVSLGVAELGDSAKTVPHLVGAADRALYEAKHAGRNAVVLAS